APIRNAEPLPCRIGAEVPDFDAKQHVEKSQRKNLKLMARTIQMGVAAAQMAVNESDLRRTPIDPTRFGVEFGCGLIGMETDELIDASRPSYPGRDSVDLQVWGEQGVRLIQPTWMLKYLPNMPACHISILHDAQGPSNSITESDAAG